MRGQAVKGGGAGEAVHAGNLGILVAGFDLEGSIYDGNTFVAGGRFFWQKVKADLSLVSLRRARRGVMQFEIESRIGRQEFARAFRQPALSCAGRPTSKHFPLAQVTVYTAFL